MKGTRPIQGLLWLAAVLLYLLIIWGGVVTASHSGLGCGPDWPNCQGQYLPPASLAGDIEWGHRLAAGIIGILVAAAGLLTFFDPPSRQHPVRRWLAAAAIVFLVTQIILGAITVKDGLPALIVALHEGTAIALLVTTLALALESAIASGPSPRAEGGRPLWIWATLLLATLTAMLGSYLAHLNLLVTGFGEAIRHLGQANSASPIGPGWWHWLAAGLLLLLGYRLIHRGMHFSPATRKLLGAGGLLLGVQALLGLLLLGTKLSAWVLVLHEAIGVATIAVWGLAAVQASREGHRGRQNRPA